MLNSLNKVRINNLTQSHGIITLLMIITILTLPFSADAKIYKWVDEDGKTHYSSEKPADAPVERVKVDIKPTFGGENVDPNDKKDKKDEKAGDKEGATEGDKNAKPAPPAEKISKQEKAANCKSSRERLKNLQNSTRIRDAERNILSEKERQKRIKGAKLEVRDWCN